MGLIIDKLGRVAAHAFAANGLVYRMRRAGLRRVEGAGELPELDGARHRILSLRPRLEVPLPRPHDSWPDTPAVDISVIIPCYNAERFVCEAVRSVQGQRCEATIEVIAVDDGSTDGTLSLLGEMADEDGRLRVVSQQNRGLNGARNAGLRVSRGASIVFVDADDVLAPGALQVLYSKLKSTGVDYVTGMYRYVDERGRAIPVGKKRPSGVAWGRIFDREVWRALEFPEGVWFEDTVHAYMVAPRFMEARVDDVVYSYRKQAGSITSTSRFSKRSVDTFFVTEAMLAWREAMGLPFDQQTYDQTLYQLGTLLANRTVALDDDESRCLFAIASNLIKTVSGGGSLRAVPQKNGSTSKDRSWKATTSCGAWSQHRYSSYDACMQAS